MLDIQAKFPTVCGHPIKLQSKAKFTVSQLMSGSMVIYKFLSIIYTCMYSVLANIMKSFLLHSVYNYKEHICYVQVSK